jgi:hypothetical protein
VALREDWESGCKEVVIQHLSFCLAQPCSRAVIASDINV